MQITSGALCTAIDYLTAFGSDKDVVTFSPLGRLVRATIQTDQSYGEYWLKPTESLQERFALSLQSLTDFSKQLGDDLLRYQPASTARFVGKSQQWWFPYCSMPDREMPTVNTQQSVRWSSTLSRYLSPLDTATGRVHDGSCLDCVFVDQRAQRESLVATNGQVMVAYSRRNKSKMPCPRSLLLKVSDVKPFQKLCESQAPVDIKIGLTKFSARCGRRFAIFDLRDGRFPRWERWYAKGKAVVLGSTNPTGTVSTTTSELAKACRLGASKRDTISIASRGDGLRFSSSDSRNQTSAMLRSNVVNYFGPIQVQSSYLKQLADSWPFPNVRLYYQKADAPIVMSSPESDPNLIALIMPVVG